MYGSTLWFACKSVLCVCAYLFVYLLNVKLSLYWSDTTDTMGQFISLILILFAFFWPLMMIVWFRGMFGRYCFSTGHFEFHVLSFTLFVLLLFFCLSYFLIRTIVMRFKSVCGFDCSRLTRHKQTIKPPPPPQPSSPSSAPFDAAMSFFSTYLYLSNL